MSTFPYDVALSFAGEDREYVQKVATALQDQGVKIFYDDFEQVSLWGKDLAEFLDQVYRLQARYCVVFVSLAYAEKAWTTHERKSALARAIEQRGEYILPAKFDDTELDGIQPTIGYIDLRRLSPDDFAGMIIKKLGRPSQQPASSPTPTFRTPRVRGRNFNPYSEAISFMTQVQSEITSR